MGREIRKVPPHYEHPKKDGDYIPQHDSNIDMPAWLAEFDRVRNGNLTADEKRCYPNGLQDWLQDEGRPPDPKAYRTYDDKDATWFQMYETVSEGTPVSPPFATKQQLVDYLAERGDFWDQKRGRGGWDRSVAEQFVERGHAFSMMVSSTGQVKTPRDGA